tara:strand:+ start:612 stop:1019 length:408 start_codon:yes stop_codon:yes gene_type:complete
MGSYISSYDEHNVERITYYILHKFPYSQYGFISSLGDLRNIRFKKNKNNVYKIIYYKNNSEYCYYAFEIMFFSETQQIRTWKYVLKDDVITVDEFPSYFKHHLHRNPTYKDWGKFFDLDLTKSQFIFKNSFFELF